MATDLTGAPSRSTGGRTVFGGIRLWPLGFFALLLAGCGTSLHGPSGAGAQPASNQSQLAAQQTLNVQNTATPGSGDVAPAVGALSATRTYGPVRLDPPGADVAKTTALQAAALCTHRAAPCYGPNPQEVDLAAFSDPNTGDTRRLVWALIWSHVDCLPLGPPGRPTFGANVNITTGCDFVSFVDANTGAYFLAVDAATQSG